jgi:hypothetical protein
MLMQRLAALDLEQESIDKRRAEAKALLAALPAEAKRGRAAQRKQAGAAEVKKDSISSLIIRAVANKPGASAADVVSAVHATRPEVDGKVIHAILYRLRAVDNKIRNEGERGDMTYYVASSGKSAREPRGKRRPSPPYKALAKKFVTGTPGQHTVAEVSKVIGCANHDQVRNILVRLNNAGAIHRVSEGVYEANAREASVPSG